MLKLRKRPIRSGSATLHLQLPSTPAQRHLSASISRCQDSGLGDVKPILDLKSIRVDPTKHAENCKRKNYLLRVPSAEHVVRLHKQWRKHEDENVIARKKIKQIESEIPSSTDNKLLRNGLIAKASGIRDNLDEVSRTQDELQERILKYAFDLPNFTSKETPIGKISEVIRQNDPPKQNYDRRQDHVKIGQDLELIDFKAASRTTGSGFYYLLNEAADLEHALIQYALKVARKAGYRHCSPPSLVHNHIGSACGYQPRNVGETREIYQLADWIDLTGTAEIPFAGMEMGKVLRQEQLPQRLVGSSRCYRREAGSHGTRDRGLYRVHEFSKVEMFAWTMPGQELEIFHQLVAIQEEIISSLNLPYRLIEVPSFDLGAPAYRKQDIEVFFPSRRSVDDGWGEVTSTSICTDYQTRRLGTRLKLHNGKLDFPSTLNGTAMAVPRMLAAVLEHGWQEHGVIVIPEVLRPFMDGRAAITRSNIESPESE